MKTKKLLAALLTLLIFLSPTFAAAEPETPAQPTQGALF